MSTTKTNTQLPPGVRESSRRTISSELLGDSMTWTKYSQETQGAYTEMRATIKPGYTNPLHYHTKFTESFTCTAGELTVVHNGKTLILTPADGTVTIEIGDTHSLLNSGKEPAEFVTKLVPGCEGFERAMYIMHGLANDGASTGEGVPKDPVKAALLLDIMDTTLVGWGWWLATPLFALLRRGGQGMGVEDSLLKKYWFM